MRNPSRQPKAKRDVPADAAVRRRLAPAVRRAALLDSALDVFAKRGFEHATLQDIAERAGVTKGALYHYFESKKELLLELMRERLIPAVVAREELLGSATGPRDQVLRTLIGGMWQQLQVPGQIELARLAITELPKYPELGRILFKEVTLRSRQTLRQALERGIECGELSAGLIEEAVAVLPYMVMGVALGQHVFRGIDTINLDADKGEAVVTTLLLRGVGESCTGPARRPRSARGPARRSGRAPASE